MEKIFRKPLLVFSVISLVLLMIFFLFPINIFDGEIVVERGLQNFTTAHNLSLSNFIGIGTEGMKEQGIVDFYLTIKGILIAAIIIIGLPGMFAYRMYLKVNSSKAES